MKQSYNLSESQKEAIEGFCPEIVRAAREYVKPRPSSEKGHFRKYGIICAEAIIKKSAAAGRGISREDIVDNFQRYIFIDEHKEVIDAATEIADVAFANLGR